MSVREETRQSGNGIRRLKSKLHDSARRADTLSRESGDLQDRLDQFIESNGPDNRTNSGTLATHLFILLLIPAVYFIDFFLFGSTAEILAERVFYDMPAMIWAARIIIPALIIIVEMALALLIYSTKREAETYYGSRVAYRGWLALGFLFALVMPSLVIGTNLFEVSFESESVQKAIYWQIIGIVTFAFVTHILIIFSGRLAQDAKSYFLAKIQRTSLQRRIKQCTTAYDYEAQSFRRNFDSFYELLTNHRGSLENNYDPGPFDNITRNFARAVYGYDVIQPDDSFNSQHTQGDQDPDDGNDNPDNDAGAENNNGTDPRIRDEESEVRI